jgi:hypothetical protein
MSLPIVNDVLIDALVRYKGLLDANASVFDSIAVNEELEIFEDQDGSKPYFVLCTYQEMIIFTTFDNSIDTLLDLSNEICTRPLLSAVHVTIYKTTKDGGTAMYVHSPLGMVFLER